MFAAPYKSLHDSLLAAASSFLLTVLFGCSYAFKNAALVGLVEIHDKMSNEQKELYIVSQDTLIFITLASMTGTLVMTVVIFAVQVVVETEKANKRRKERAGRLLRNEYTGEIVSPAPLRPNETFRAPTLSRAAPVQILNNPSNDRVWDCRLQICFYPMRGGQGRTKCVLSRRV